jgi:hypothetical protein
MTDDDELEARLRRLAPARSAKDAAFWRAMADDVRAAYERESRARRVSLRRRRFVASMGGALAMAAALTLWLRGHHVKPPAPAEPADTFHVFEDLEPGEMLEELSPEQIEHLAKAFNKGA